MRGLDPRRSSSTLGSPMINNQILKTMKTTTESVMIVSTEHGEVIAMVRKDLVSQKNLIHRVTDAKLSDIENILSKGHITPIGGDETDESLIPEALIEKKK